MKPTTRFCTSALLAGALSLSLSSCWALTVGAGAGAAAYYYKSSESAEVKAEPSEVVAAAEAVLQDMHLEIDDASFTKIDGQVLARTATDERVKVAVDAQSAGGSKVTVRVGLVDEEAARKILNEVLERLGE